MQQVNLYQDKFKPKQERLSAKNMFAVVMVVVVIALGKIGFDGWGLYRLDQQLNEMNQQYTQMQTKLVDVKTQMVERHPNSMLVDEVKKLQLFYQRRVALQVLMEDDVFTSTNGYSSYLVALARQHITGLWLTEIKISDGGQEVAFKGKVISANLVPKYLQQLSSEDVLTGTEFDLLKMVRPKPEKKWSRPLPIEFLVSTAVEEDWL